MLLVCPSQVETLALSAVCYVLYLACRIVQDGTSVVRVSWDVAKSMTLLVRGQFDAPHLEATGPFLDGDIGGGSPRISLSAMWNRHQGVVRTL